MTAGADIYNCSAALLKLPASTTHKNVVPIFYFFYKSDFYGNASATRVLCFREFSEREEEISVCGEMAGNPGGPPDRVRYGSEKAVYEQWKYRRCKGKTG